MSSHLYNLICIHCTYILPPINTFDMQISCANIVFIIIRPVCKQQQVICVEVTVKEQHMTEDILEHKFDSHFFLQIHYAVLRQFFLDKFYLTLIVSEIEGSKGTNSKNVYLFLFFPDLYAVFTMSYCRIQHVCFIVYCFNDMRRPSTIQHFIFCLILKFFFYYFLMILLPAFLKYN